MQSNIYLLHRVSTNSLHNEEFIFESEYVSHADLICLNFDDKFSLSITFVLLYSSNSLKRQLDVYWICNKNWVEIAIKIQFTCVDIGKTHIWGNSSYTFISDP